MGQHYKVTMSVHYHKSEIRHDMTLDIARMETSNNADSLEVSRTLLSSLCWNAEYHAKVTFV